MSSKSSSTKNRRSANAAKGTNGTGQRGKSTAGPAKVAKAIAREQATNTVVGRRLAFLPDAERSALAARFAAGESIAKLAAEGNLTVTRAAYCLRQELVESGKVARINPTDVKAIKAERAKADAAWIACRTGLSGSKLDSILGS